MAGPVPGDTGLLKDQGQQVCTVTHGSTAGTARPTQGNNNPVAAPQVYWVGSVAPTHAVAGDMWWDTTNLLVKVHNGAGFDAAGSATYMPGRIVAAPTGGDDTSLIQTALTAGGHVVLQPGATYKLTGTTGLTFDPSTTRLVGVGAKIDASGMTGGVAVTLNGALSPAYPLAAHGAFDTVELFGSGSGSSVTGVKFAATAGGTGTAAFSCQRFVVHDFGIGISHGSNAHNLTCFGISVYNCGNAIDNSALVTNGGERMTFIGCDIFNNTQAFNIPTAGEAEYYFIACSLDYNTSLGTLVGNRVTLTDCHVEYTASATVPVTISGNNGLLVVKGGEWMQIGAAASTYIVTSTATGAGGATFETVQFRGIATTTGLFTASSGVYVTRPDLFDASSTATVPPMKPPLSVTGFLPRTVAFGASGAVNPGTNTAETLAFFVDEPTTLDEVLITVTTQSGNIDVGIYDATGTSGQPGKRLSHSGSVACPATGDQRVSIPAVTLAPGKYFVAISGGNGTYAIRYTSDPAFYSAGIPALRWQGASMFPLPDPAPSMVNATGAWFNLLATKS